MLTYQKVTKILNTHGIQGKVTSFGASVSIKTLPAHVDKLIRVAERLGWSTSTMILGRHAKIEVALSSRELIGTPDYNNYFDKRDICLFNK